MPKSKKDSGLAIGTLESKKDESFMSTGIVGLDEVLGGGIARGRILELWGSPGVGKTHLATMIMANVSKELKVLYVDSEYALNKARVRELGADPKNIGYIANSALEVVCEALVSAVGKYDLIILDSLAQLTPLSVANAEVGERSIGLFALLIKHWVLKFRPLLANSKTAFVALNQYRPPIGLYATETPPGGMSWTHACDVRIKLSTNSSDRFPEGHFVHLTVKKNRLGKPGLTSKVKILY